MNSPEHDKVSEHLSDPEITHSPELRDLVVGYFTEAALSSDKDVIVELRPRDGEVTTLWLTHFYDDKRLAIESKETISCVIKKSGAEHRFAIYRTLDIDAKTGEIFGYYEKPLEYDEHGSIVESTIEYGGPNTNQTLSDQQNDMLDAMESEFDELSTFTQDKLAFMINLFTTQA